MILTEGGFMGTNFNTDFYFEALYDGTNRNSRQGDNAALAKVNLHLIREQFQRYQTELAGRSVNLDAHRPGIAQAEQGMDELERYFEALEQGRKRTMKDTDARKVIGSVKEQFAALERLL
jgi:hypothetical protein